MLPEGSVGSSAPACWYNSVTVVEPSTPEPESCEGYPIEEVSANPLLDNSLEENHTNKEQHFAHIEKLAQPKKSCLTDKPFPARLHLKKKVVAFGRTVNYSQTIEGTSRRDPPVNKPLCTVNRVTENKENKPPSSTKAAVNKLDKSKRKSSEMVEKSDEHIDLDINNVKELLQKNEEKNEALFAQVFKKLEELAMTQRPASNSRQEDIRRPYKEKKPDYRAERKEIIESIERHLEVDPTFVAELSSFCRSMESKLGYSSPTPSDEYQRSARQIVPRNVPLRERPDIQRGEGRSGGAIVTERMTVERSFLSPAGEQFSVDSRRFLGNRGLINRDQDLSPARSRNFQNGPQSYYQPGYSVTYVPQKDVQLSDDEENCGTVLQLTDEQYEKQCAAREAKLRGGPLITEIDNFTDSKNVTPDERKRREVLRQLEEKRKRRDEILKK